MLVFFHLDPTFHHPEYVVGVGLELVFDIGARTPCK
jgi:hypothetical protein